MYKRSEGLSVFARRSLLRPPAVLVGAALFVGVLAMVFASRLTSTSAAAGTDWGAGIVAALPANAWEHSEVFIDSVSCSSAGNCSAVGTYVDASGNHEGLLLTETDGKWAVGVEAKLPANASSNQGVSLDAISCASAGNCTAVGSYADSAHTDQGLLLTETDGTWAPGFEAVIPSNASSSTPDVGIASVSCASAGNCSAVGSYNNGSSFQGLLLTETAGTWSAGVEAVLPGNSATTPQQVSLASISCASPGNCSAVGSYDTGSWVSQGLLLTETSGSWAPGVEAALPANADPASPEAGLKSVSCASPGNCTAVGSYADHSSNKEGLLLTETAGGWATGVEASLPANAAMGTPGGPLFSLSSVSCASAGNCTAVGTYYDSSDNGQGLLLSETGGTWASGLEAALPPDASTTQQGVQLSSVSCSSVGNCGAVGSYGVSTGGGEGLLVSETGGSWATGVEASLPSNASPINSVSMSSVSCAAADDCSAVGSYLSWGGEFGLLIGGEPPLVTLHVSTNGTGSGTLASSPAGMSCGTVCSYAYPAGTLVTLTATPAAGSTFAGWGVCTGTGTCAIVIDADTTITATFNLASTPKPCLVPNLKGQTLPAAIRSIKASACTVGTVRRINSRAIKQGQVISQTPTPGTPLMNGEKVDLVVSSGPPARGASRDRCRVPRLAGLSLDAAKKELRRAGCRAGVIRYHTSTLPNSNHVLAQKPSRGHELTSGAKVGLVVGMGPKTGRLPSLGAILPRRLPPYIAYSPASGGIWLVKPDGSDAHQVGPAGAGGPVWSPDATQILFIAPAPQNLGGISADAYVMDADGTDQRLIMPSAGFEWGDGGFQWSPDGNQLAFTQGQEMGHDLQTANANGTDARPVPNTAWGGDASFSPDGRYLVFDSIFDGTNPSLTGPPHLFVIKPGGTHLRQITWGDGEEYPSWSPDGTRVVYACLRDAKGQTHGICELSGNHPRQRILYVNQKQTFVYPKWNGNGTKILVTIEEPEYGARQIALMSPSGGKPVEITHGPGSTWLADW